MLTVHHLGISQSERIVWLCEELAIPYELKKYDRGPETRLAPKEYKALHPMGIAPVITDGNLVLGESGAIMEYIIAKYGNGRLAVQPDDPDFPQYLYWMHAGNGTVAPVGMVLMIAKMLSDSDDNPIIKAFATRDENAFAMMEQQLGETSYFAGEKFTAADIMMVFLLTTIRLFAPRDLSGFPNIRAYLIRISERPAYQKAMALGDPGMPLLLD
jgi:glutathione S-transferase